MNLSRRGLLGRAALVGLAAPAVITTPGLLMRVRSLFLPSPMFEFSSAGLTLTDDDYFDEIAPSTSGLLTPSLIASEALLILHNNMVADGKVNAQFDRHFDRIGRELQVRVAEGYA